MNLFTTPLFPDLKKAFFLRRLNRFVIECSLDGMPVTAHLPNPGRLWELLLPGRTVLLTPNDTRPLRTTPYTAVSVLRSGVPILLHTQMTNTVVRFLLEEGRLPGLEDTRIVQHEVSFGHSRFDFLLQKGKDRLILEVKSCTLFGRDLAMFPDAVTLRGRKHLLELSELSRQGFACAVLFVVSTLGVRRFLPDFHTDFAFSQTLRDVRQAVAVQAVGLQWHEDLTLRKDIRDIPIPWTLLEKEGHDRGCYLLMLHLSEDRIITIGGLGPLHFPKGYYLYAGSARRHLAKRLERHGRRRKTFFWHIDYLRDAASSCLALPIRTGDDLEHELADAVSRIAHWSVPRFGASDCRCDTHLFGMAGNPIHDPSFIQLLQDFRMDRLTPDAG